MAIYVAEAPEHKRLIAIFGGTFDPVHIGHLRTVMDLQQLLPIDEILLVPNRQPPHRNTPLLDAETRFKLLQSALTDLDGLRADDSELKRPGSSYMVDTLRELKQRSQNEVLCLIIGMDAFNDFCHWHQWQDILELCHLLVMARPGVEQQQNHQLDERIEPNFSRLLDLCSGKVFIQQVSQLDISSTRIREMVKAGQDIRFLVPESIRCDVENLYKG